MISLVALKRIYTSAQGAVMGGGLGVACGAVVGLGIYLVQWQSGQIVRIGIFWGLAVGMVVGSWAEGLLASKLPLGKFPRWRRDINPYGVTLVKINAATGGLLGIVAGILYSTDSWGSLVAPLAGLLFGALAVRPVALAYLFTAGLILDTPFISGFFLLARAAAACHLCSRQEIQDLDARQHYFRAAEYDVKGKIEQAVNEYEKAIALWEESPETDNQLGCNLGIVGRLDEEVSAYENILAQKPDALVAMHDLAECLRDLGNEQEAEIWERKADSILAKSRETGDTEVIRNHRLVSGQAAQQRLRTPLRPSTNSQG